MNEKCVLRIGESFFITSKFVAILIFLFLLYFLAAANHRYSDRVTEKVKVDVIKTNKKIKNIL